MPVRAHWRYAPYEEPENPTLVIDTSLHTVEYAVDAILKKILFAASVNLENIANGQENLKPASSHSAAA